MHFDPDGVECLQRTAMHGVYYRVSQFWGHLKCQRGKHLMRQLHWHEHHRLHVAQFLSNSRSPLKMALQGSL